MSNYPQVIYELVIVNHKQGIKLEDVGVHVHVNVNRWVTSDWTHCPEDICHLGDDFIQNRWAFCVKDSTQQGANWERVDDIMCSGDIKPELSRACDKSHCIPESFWKTGPWTECSVTCGVGVQHRNVECVTVEDDNTVLNSVCTDERPSSIETCSKIPCEEENPDQDLGSDEIGKYLPLLQN